MRKGRFLDQLSKNEFVRFLVIGGLNSVFSWLLYYFFLLFTNYTVSFLLSFIVSNIAGYVASSRYAIAVKPTRIGYVVYLSGYVVVYAVGQTTLSLLIELIGIGQYLAIVFASAVIAPSSFLVLKIAAHVSQRRLKPRG